MPYSGPMIPVWTALHPLIWQESQKWAVEEMKITAHAAKAMGEDVVTFFMGSPIWKFWYSFPQTTEEMVEDGFRKVKEL